MQQILNIIRLKTFTIASYLDVLFFFEIMNFMFLLLMLYGKLISIAAGILLSVLLSIHIMSLYFKKERSRKIQLFLMDLHLAYSIPFLLNLGINDDQGGLLNYLFISVRFFITCFDIIFIFALSDYKSHEPDNLQGNT